jgi:hypothetical protein
MSGRRKKEEGRRKKEEGRRKKEHSFPGSAWERISARLCLELSN